VQGIITAAETAWRSGIPFNSHVTVHWAKLGLADDEAAPATGALLTLLRDWLRKQGLPFAYAYARENGATKGSHVHILAHLPPGAGWNSQRSRRWLKRIADGPYFTGAIRTKRIRGTCKGRVILPELYAANLADVVSYLTKGALPQLAAVLTIRRVEPGGHVVGKRAGWSQNVGAKASGASGAGRPLIFN